MSYPKNTAQSRITRISIGILVAGSALAVASAVIPSTGAWFFAQQPGRVVATTGSMSFTLADDQGAISNNGAPFELRYNGLAPGAPQTQTFTLTNTGSLAGYADISLSGLTISGSSNPNPSQLRYSVNGGNSFALAQNGRQSVSLGTVQAGASRTVTVTLSLDDEAGPEWQDVSVTNALNISLAQAH